MGTVYRAEDTRLGRQVAIKVLHDDLASDEDWNRRFHREVRASSAVSHPGIATLYDFHRDRDTAFFTMEFVEGRTLREVLADGPMPLPDLLEAMIQLSGALAEAHRKGVVHRDLKPENVMTSRSGFYKILDFGLARIQPPRLAHLDSGSRLETISRDDTEAGKLVGTVTYMSPEQAQGLEVGPRSDLFTFGGMIYELATGTAPFSRKNALATFHAIVHEDPVPMTERRPDLPIQLEWIVGHCLAKDPQDRYESADALAADLRSLATASEAGLRRVAQLSPAALAGRHRRRRAIPAIAAAIVIAVATALGAIYFLSRAPGEGPIPAAGSAVPASLADGGYLAVSSFSNNTGDVEADWLSRGVPEMLTTELAGFTELRVISTERMNDLLEMAGREDDVDQATTMELARWAGAGIVVSGSIFKGSDGYRIDAQAYDTASGRIVTVAKAEGTQVFGMISALTSQLVKGLRVATRDAPNVANLTDSEDAFRHYTRGMDLYRDLHFDEGIEAFRHAVEADPAFALARLRLGMSHYLHGDKEKGLKEIESAAAGSSEMPERSGELTRLVRAFFLSGPDASLPLLEAYLSRYPEDQEANFWRAMALADVEGDRGEAIRILHRILAEEGNNLPAVSGLATQLIDLGRPEDAEQILRDYLVRNPGAEEPLNRLITTAREAARPGHPGHPPAEGSPEP